jgi:CRISPR/Cas system-associated endoribonuclease Cas2
MRGGVKYMAVYAVTYDLHNPGQKYEEVSELLKSLGGWWKHFDSFWLISTSQHTAANIRDALKEVTDTNDKIFVIKVSENWAAYNVSETGTDWLKKHL